MTETRRLRLHLHLLCCLLAAALLCLLFALAIKDGPSVPGPREVLEVQARETLKVLKVLKLLGVQARESREVLEVQANDAQETQEVEAREAQEAQEALEVQAYEAHEAREGLEVQARDVREVLEDQVREVREVLEVNAREVREVKAPNRTEEITPRPLVVAVNRTDVEQCVYIDAKLLAPTDGPPAVTQAPRRKGDYPPDLFSLQQRQQGWALLHLAGMAYMFVSLAIVCDEFFVPALEVVACRLRISDDVAGATFMAAGGSAPELFTSLIGVFVSHSNVGVGTIVGSAVFNVLFVVGTCAIFSHQVLRLTWWPLFRDVTFYVVALLMLIVFFLDDVILWWESALLLLAYFSYVTFMKFNERIERAVKTLLAKRSSLAKVEPQKESDPPPVLLPAPPAVPPAAPPAPLKAEPEALPSSPQGTKQVPATQEERVKVRVRPILQRGGSSASLHNTSLRNTIFQLMIHTLDPLGEEGADKPKEEQASASGAAGGAAAKPSTSQPPKKKEVGEGTVKHPDGSKMAAVRSAREVSADEEEENSDDGEDDDDGNEEDDKEPLSLTWPESRRKQATYLLLLPVVIPLWLTLPDVRKPESRRYFVATFVGSILWIGIFSYLMVWWAHQVGETVGITEEIMGLTILAAGTSIPDLITSVIVARKGLGDMAVSSSVGSNIFDITVGLPVPWLLYTLIHQGQPVTVTSNGLFCAIVLLFLMLLFVIASIAACRWRMSRVLGVTMFALYFVFLVLSILLEERVIICPVST
ncbi:sodium/potassium/calcium exchanger 2-like [Nelusetta ayraudi]|uniref:sodium/potassium/calcium exchanger 2-like n=1 Tax=Nelusetta ayraudi TaxID=303726 RepID=UPI003F6EC38A